MQNISTSYLILSFMLCYLLQATVTIRSLTSGPDIDITSIGAILDQTSRAGKEAKVSIEIAIQDSNKITHYSVVYPHNKHVHPAIAAKELISEHNVKAILGGHTWEEASAIADVIRSEHDHNISKFLSLATTTPLQTTDRWPFFVQAVPTQSTQMNAVAAILQSWGIRQVTLIFETSSSASIISHLSQAFRKTDCVLTNIVPLTNGSSSLNEELEVLKRQQRQVFVIHTSLQLAARLFQTAKKMEMTGDGYLWIATNQITDLFHSINPATISSFKGMVGVKTYFPDNTPDFLDFRNRFRHKFRSDYPDEDQDEPGIFAVQGYNAVKLLEQSSPEKFVGTVEIINVIGKGYHSVYWTKGSGFSETVGDDIYGPTTYTNSMEKLGQALWPVQPWYAHRQHRNLAESSKYRMRVAIPGRSLIKQFVSVEFHPKNNKTVFSGFAVAVFDEMMKQVSIPYDCVPFYGSYDELVETIRSKEFDAVAGDVMIASTRYEFADFTQPYTESGLEMIVPVRSTLANEEWLFMKPFTTDMWWFIAAITIYNGFIIWLIERDHCEDLRGSVITQIGIIIWLAFTTLFTLRGDKLHSNLSRMAVAVWLFVALVITQSYTASLASMLTAQRLEPAITSIEMLRNMNATVGYCNGSFINYYLKDVLGFKSVKINSYTSTSQYAEALNSGEIAAIFLEVPAAKVFLAQYCKSFIRTGETFKVGGFGFAFPRGFSRLSDANKALMNISESGKLKELEDTFLNSEKCVDEETSPDENNRLSLHSFWVLFKFTVGTSTVALTIYSIIKIREQKKSNQEHTNLFKVIPTLIKDWQFYMKQSSSVVVNIESAKRAQNIDH